MYVTWIYGVVAIGGIIVTAINGERYRRKYNKLKSEYNKRCKELTNALGEVGRDKILIESMQDTNADFMERDEAYRRLLYSGCHNLAVKEREYPVINGEFPKGEVAVVGQLDEGKWPYFVIKSFLFNPHDQEDREFAIRQAEELIETIKNF